MKSKLLSFVLIFGLILSLFTGCNGDVDEQLFNGTGTEPIVKVTYTSGSSRTAKPETETKIIKVPSRVVLNSFLADNDIAPESVQKLEFYGIREIQGNNNDGTTFARCKKLTSVIMDEALKDIGEYAFYQTIDGMLPIGTLEMKAVERIGKYAFNGCNQLKEVTFPETVKAIEERAFYECSILQTLVFTGNNPPTTIASDTFNSEKVKDVLVPKGSSASYKSAFENTGLKDKVVEKKADETTYTVTFNSNGGNGTMEAQTFTHGETKALSENTFTAPAGKIFAGWSTTSDGDAVYSDKQEISLTSDMTLYAKWDYFYTVTFNSNGGNGTMEAQTFIHGETKALSENTFTAPAGKIFAGWSTTSDGDAVYSDKQEISLTSDMTLYAKWDYFYTVTFNGNGGNGTMEAQTFIHGETKALSENTFTAPASMMFVGWSTTSDGDAVYTDKQEISLTSDMTLYAKWDFAYLCFTAEAAGSTVKMSVVGTLPTTPALKYSEDGSTWTTFDIGTTTVTLANVGDKVYLRGNNYSFSRSETDFIQFIMAGKISASGNVMSLLDLNCQSKDLTGKDYVFSRLFDGCTALTTTPELPATTLADMCYYGMFSGCTSLTSTPTLPATELKRGCYMEMFYQCAALTTASELPATILARSCYDSMFWRCTSLTTAPELPATTLADNCYRSMFNYCTNLTTAPELKAQVLVYMCYFNMFCHCTSLYQVTMLATDITATDCLTAWLFDTTDSGTLKVANDAMVLALNNDAYRPSGWTVSVNP